MKHTIISIIALLFSLVVFGQNKKPDNEYSEAREIIKDLDSIVTPNGIQKDIKPLSEVLNNGYMFVDRIKKTL